MTTVKVCIGSSCHLKGSYDVLEGFKKLIEDYNVADRCELKAAFCLGHCAEGVNVVAGEILVHRVNADNAEEVFVRDVLPLLG